MQLVLTPELIVEAYKQGLFPMAYNAGSPYVHWICPEMRGQLSITDIHIPRSLKKTIRNRSYHIKIDTAFDEVVQACAEPGPSRPETWINDSIMEVFCQLHERGQAHSLECWQDGILAGGLYGLAIGGAFFGESMFTRKTNASKIALIHLAARLWAGGFTLLDTQFANDHLKQFGVYEIPYEDYKSRLTEAILTPADFLLENRDHEDILSSYLAMRAEQNP